MRRYFLIVFLVLPAFVACTQRAGQLKPLRPDGSDELLLAAQPQLVTFSELQADPEAFQDRLIRVSGALLKLPPPECLPKSGPAVAWALIAEELRLDAVGFERIISLSSDDLPMTVDGFFRLYEGPLGCGKGAPDGSAWFLEVIRIVQPNPLVGAGRPSGSIGFSTATSGGLSPTPGSPLVPTPTFALPGSGTPGGVPTMTPTGQTPSPPTATVEASTATATLIPTATATGVATSEFTPTPTPTPPPGTPTPTPTATRGSGPTLTPTPTATRDPYIGPPTPTATPTLDGYPGATATSVPTTYP